MEALLKTEKRRILQKGVYRKLRAAGVYTHTDPAYESSRRSEGLKDKHGESGETRLWLPGDPPVSGGPGDSSAGSASLNGIKTGSQQLSKGHRPGASASPAIAESSKEAVLFSLKNDRGEIIYRRDSFRRLLDNDSAKYHENGPKEVFEEFQKYSIKSQYLINNKLKGTKIAITD